jgi:transposase
MTKPAPVAALGCIGSAKTAPRCWTTSPQLRVRVIRRPRYGWRVCEGAVVQAPVLERPIDGGLAIEALLAQVLIGEDSDHLPLYRQSQIFARQGVTLDRSPLCNWAGRACWWLTPLHDLMLSTVLASPKVFADDTTLPVLDPGRGRTKTGRLWCYGVDNRPWQGPGYPAAAYVYSEDRKADHPASHLTGFNGLLQVDGDAGFGRLVSGDGATRLAFCWALCDRGRYPRPLRRPTTPGASTAQPPARCGNALPADRATWPHLGPFRPGTSDPLRAQPPGRVDPVH